MCGDWHTADDAVSTAIVKVHRNWHRISRMENVDAYVRRAVVNAGINERRRLWRRERLVLESPPAVQPDDERSLHDRMSLLKHLKALPPRQRAAIVLRFYCDLSVEQTAQVLECSPGTVKSQTARALATLRASASDIHDLV
jgi:RNA polymerase sigma-70 factor (sigma-E family)